MILGYLHFRKPPYIEPATAGKSSGIQEVFWMSMSKCDRWLSMWWNRPEDIANDENWLWRIHGIPPKSMTVSQDPRVKIMLIDISKGKITMMGRFWAGKRSSTQMLYNYKRLIVLRYSMDPYCTCTVWWNVPLINFTNWHYVEDSARKYTGWATWWLRGFLIFVPDLSNTTQILY